MFFLVFRAVARNLVLCGTRFLALVEMTQRADVHFAKKTPFGYICCVSFWGLQPRIGGEMIFTRRKIGAALRVLLLPVEFGADGDRGAERAEDRAFIHMDCEGPIDLVLILPRGRQPVDNMDPFDHQDLFLQLHLAPGLSHQAPSAHPYFPCIQRTAEGSGQSAGGGSDNVIERGGMRFGMSGVTP